MSGDVDRDICDLQPTGEPLRFRPPAQSEEERLLDFPVSSPEGAGDVSPLTVPREGHHSFFAFHTADLCRHSRAGKMEWINQRTIDRREEKKKNCKLHTLPDSVDESFPPTLSRSDKCHRSSGMHPCPPGTRDRDRECDHGLHSLGRSGARSTAIRKRKSVNGNANPRPLMDATQTTLSVDERKSELQMD